MDYSNFDRTNFRLEVGKKYVTQQGWSGECLRTNLKGWDGEKKAVVVLTRPDGVQTAIMYYLNGAYVLYTHDSDYDLFPIPRKVTLWHNVYPDNVSGFYLSSVGRDTEKMAKEHADPGCIGQVSITVEVP